MSFAYLQRVGSKFACLANSNQQKMTKILDNWTDGRNFCPSLYGISIYSHRNAFYMPVQKQKHLRNMVNGWIERTIELKNGFVLPVLILHSVFVSLKCDRSRRSR